MITNPEQADVQLTDAPTSLAAAGVVNAGAVIRSEHREDRVAHSSVGTTGGDVPGTQDLGSLLLPVIHETLRAPIIAAPEQADVRLADVPTSLAAAVFREARTKSIPASPPTMMGATRVIHTGGVGGQIWLPEGTLAFAKWNNAWYYKYADHLPAGWEPIPQHWWAQ